MVFNNHLISDIRNNTIYLYDITIKYKLGVTERGWMRHVFKKYLSKFPCRVIQQAVPVFQICDNRKLISKLTVTKKKKRFGNAFSWKSIRYCQRLPVFKPYSASSFHFHILSQVLSGVAQLGLTSICTKMANKLVSYFVASAQFTYSRFWSDFFSFLFHFCRCYYHSLWYTYAYLKSVAVMCWISY